MSIIITVYWRNVLRAREFHEFYVSNSTTHQAESFCMMMLNFDKSLVIVTRFICLGIFLYCSVSVTAQSVVAALALLVSIFFLQPTKTAVTIRTKVVNIRKENAFRKKNGPYFEDQVSDETISRFNRLLAESLTYDAKEVKALTNFRVIQLQSQCAFAKNANLWGSDDYLSHLSLEENIRRSFPTFLKFTCVCHDLCLDGFLFEFPGAIYGRSVETLGEAVQKLLHILSDLDPVGQHSTTSVENIESPSWVFRLNDVSFFITSFAPCYPPSNSRFAFGAKNAYVLFQPEISFARHDLPHNTSESNWNSPKTIRDRIRVAFRDAGRPYFVPEKMNYPMVWDVVKPFYDGGGTVKWWTDESKLK